MKKFALFLFVIPAIILSQSCKKSSNDDAAAVTPPILQAYIGTPVWTPDTLSASITYNAATNTRVLKISGVKAQKKIDIVFNDPTPGNANAITLGSYKVDATSNLQLIYSTQKKGADGSYIFEQFGTVQPNSGNLVIAGIDPARKILTGTFNFTSSKTNYDQNGNVISIDLAPVSNGTFQDLPYTFETK